MFHDDQHGTAIVVLAALYNALKVADKKIEDIRVVVNGGGSAGLSVARRFLAAGVKHVMVLNPAWIKTMAPKPIIFAMANPEPEIFPDEALAAGAYIVGTGRSDFANQINNVLAFPGIFRGALDARARKITIDMQIAAAKGIASLIPDDELSTTNIIANAFDGDVAEVVAESVRNAAKATAKA